MTKPQKSVDPINLQSPYKPEELPERLVNLVNRDARGRQLVNILQTAVRNEDGVTIGEMAQQAARELKHFLGINERQAQQLTLYIISEAHKMLQHEKSANSELPKPSHIFRVEDLGTFKLRAAIHDLESAGKIEKANNVRNKARLLEAAIRGADKVSEEKATINSAKLALLSALDPLGLSDQDRASIVNNIVVTARAEMRAASR